MAERHKAYFLSSASATLKNLKKNTATWYFSDVQEYTGASIAITEFSFFNSFINISAALANNMIYYSDASATPT